MCKFGVILFAVVAQAQTLPSNWAGSGAGWNPAGSPKVTAWASYAKLVSEGQKLYSYTSYDVIPQRNAVPKTAVRTGFATVIRTFGPNL